MDSGRMMRNSQWLWVTVAVAGGILLRSWFIQHGPAVAGDALIYGDIAKNLIRNGIYGFSKVGGGVRPTLLRLPGYPLFLAGCFLASGMENYRAVMYLQAAIDLTSCGLIAGTAAQLFGRRAGWSALYLAALCPFTANYTAVALTETLSIFCVAAAMYGVLHWEIAGCRLNRWVFVTGSAMAYAVLLRPEQGLLAAALLPTMVWSVLRAKSGGRLRSLAPVLLAATLIGAPLGVWAARNWHVFHVLQPLAPRNANDPGEPVPAGFQRWFRTWGVDFISTDQVYWRYDTDPILTNTLPLRAFDTAKQYQETEGLLEDYNQTTTATSAFDARFKRIADQRIQASWWRYYIYLPLARLANMLFRPRTELLPLPLDWWHRGVGWRLSLGFALLNLGYFGLAGWSFFRLRTQYSAAVWGMVAFCILRCVLLATIDNSEPRYTLELFPVIITLGAGVVSCSRASINFSESCRHRSNNSRP